MTLLKTESFVPLTTTPASGDRPDFRVSVLSKSDQSRPFQSLDEQLPPPALPTGDGRNCQPRIAVQRDGDRVASIRIQCSCGQVMDLGCVYQEPAKSA
ncbi:MAG TPA: hypothetical protein VH255_07595 [Verrucomicrobiae bacterium]|nr:hypothetical protein [Verrucomicrobiae bacterium]